MRDRRSPKSLMPIFSAVVSLNAATLAIGAETALKAHLTTAPNVPPPITRSTPARVLVELEAKEFVGTLAEGVQYKFWSFNGTVPAPMIRVRVGDTVELHLKNSKDSVFSHNIDFHAVNGPGGGSGVTLVSPGQEAAFSFKALAPGLYLYHCASPVPSIEAHIANGMYGMILVEPEGGLPPIDKEYSVLQSEFYTKPAGPENLRDLSMEKGLAGHPDHVVFNGREGALVTEELTATVGQTVRLYYGNISLTGASSFHIIGEIFDRVYVEGALNGLINRNVQTTLVPSTGTAIVEFRVDVPANLILVDSSNFRIAKGAMGILSVSGEENPEVFTSLKRP